MMLAAAELRVVPATIHIPLYQVPQALTADSLEATVRVTEAGLRRDFGIAKPRLALSGLNPPRGRRRCPRGRGRGRDRPRGRQTCR